MRKGPSVRMILNQGKWGRKWECLCKRDALPLRQAPDQLRGEYLHGGCQWNSSSTRRRICLATHSDRVSELGQFAGFG